jgi:hypothetical protein
LSRCLHRRGAVTVMARYHGFNFYYFIFFRSAFTVTARYHKLNFILFFVAVPSPSRRVTTDLIFFILFFVAVSFYVASSLLSNKTQSHQVDTIHSVGGHYKNVVLFIFLGYMVARQKVCL